MKLLPIAGAGALAVAVGVAVFLVCSNQMCRGFNSLRFLVVSDEASNVWRQHQKLLADPRFAKVDAYGVSGFIDSRDECRNFKRAAQSLSLVRNNATELQSRESKIEAILIYEEARRRGCHIDQDAQ